MATLLSPILSQAGQIASISSPVPYLGPAFQLASALIDLCQNVTKNRQAAITMQASFTLFDRIRIDMPQENWRTGANSW